MDKSKNGKYSSIWNLYEVIDRNTAKCLICKGHFSYRTTISNLRKHIVRKHSTLQVLQSAVPENDSETTEYAITQSLLSHISSPQKKVPQQATPQGEEIKLLSTQPENSHLINVPQPFDLQHFAPLKRSRNEKHSIENDSDRNINDALMQLFIKHFHPVNIVKDNGFRNLIKSLNPTYEVPNKKFISQTLLPAMYDKCLENARVISRSIKRACITTESWTASNDERFLAITIHFLDNDFYFKSVLLSSLLLENSVTSESLADEIKHILNDWELQNKIIFSVSSGEDYIVNAFKRVLKWDHFECFAHSVNKVIWDALSFKPVDELISKVRKIVSFFKNNPMASSELHLSQINCNIEPKKLKQDIPTMWNSTFYMIERFVELENAISCTVTIQESNLPLIQPDEWTVLEELTKILKSLEAITKAANHENYMLASIPIVLANGLSEICRKLESCIELTDTTRHLVMKMKNGFNSRFSQLIKNPILSTCTFLDPRFKTIPFGNNGRPVKKQVVDLLIKKFNVGKNIKNGENRGTVFQIQNIEELSVWEMFDKTAAKTKLEVSASSKVQLEIDRYLEDDLINRNSDPLEWWRDHRQHYPHLSEFVIEIFCSLATSVPCSRLFTKAGNDLIDRRSKLSASKLKRLAFLNINEQLF